MATRLNKKNGLYNFVDGLVESGLAMFFDSRERRVTLYYEKLKNGISYEKFKILITDYIGKNMLVDEYKTITICEW